MEAARDAVDCLDLKDIQIMKTLGSPPADVVLCAKAVLIMKGEKKNHGWPNAQKMLGQPKPFVESLKNYDMKEIPDWILAELKTIISMDNFTYENMLTKSKSAGNLTKFVINVYTFNGIYKKVKPLQENAEAAEKLANEKLAELAIVMEKVRVIVEKVDALKARLAEAEAKKKAVVDAAEELQLSLSLANRLVDGLADEKIRWEGNVKTFQTEKRTMIGNALVSAAFVSYIGPFNSVFRQDIWANQWINDIKERGIPYTEGIDPLNVLSDDSIQAIWKTQGLPADRVSLENAAIVCSCSRYPLLIDPQLQGKKWIYGKEQSRKDGAEMLVITLQQDKWQLRVQHALTNGLTLMIQQVGENIDPLLDPLLSRQFVKKGKNFTVKIGSEDIEMMNGFQLYLQTNLINPHYKPETAAQCTIINFIVTESGLEDQLLATVVRVEKPELESTKEELVNKQNEFITTLAGLEADLLKKLDEADPETILTNIELIEGLETTKATSMEIQRQQIEAKQTEITINKMREIYRRVAAEGAMLYFLLVQLCIVDHMYQYSLEAFTNFFLKAIFDTEANEDEEKRVIDLRSNIRLTIYRWVQRGLFVKHKQLFLTQLVFRLIQLNILENAEYDA
jgi:dynein heavy chain